MRILKAAIEIIRPINCFMVAIAVFVGAVASGFLIDLDFESSSRVILAATATFLVTAAGNVMNDLKDVEEDLINQPQRAIPSGRLTKTQAFIWCIILITSSVIVILPTLNFAAYIIVSVGVILVAAYSMYLKRAGFIGNLVIGVLSALAILLGGTVLLKFDVAIWPATIACFMQIGREIVKGIADLEGDKIAGVKTLAVTLGEKEAAIVAIVFLLITIALSAFPYLLHHYNMIYLAISVVIVDGIMVLSIIRLIRNPSSAEAFWVKRLLRFGMVFGLCAFVFGVDGWLLNEH